jgi:hypothetical protein
MHANSYALYFLWQEKERCKIDHHSLSCICTATTFSMYSHCFFKSVLQQLFQFVHTYKCIVIYIIPLGCHFANNVWFLDALRHRTYLYDTIRCAKKRWCLLDDNTGKTLLGGFLITLIIIGVRIRACN